MRLYIANAFALSMLDETEQLGTPAGYVPRAGDAIGQVARIPRPVENVHQLLADWQNVGIRVVSVIGHVDTARIFSRLLDLDLPAHRATIKLARDDQVLVGQLVGSRLPEGATKLPDGAQIKWWIV